MKERRQIVQRWRQGAASVLITLVRVQGSSYRQPGARLVLCKDGSAEGSISGGCLEADVLRKAPWLVRDGAALECYSTLFDEVAEIPFGLGCGGVIHLLLEPVETPECGALMQAFESALSGRAQFVATWLPTSGREMMRAVYGIDGELMFASEGLAIEPLRQVLAKSIHNLGPDSDEVFLERLVAPQRLFVLGAGDDAKPLVNMASLLGWDITVLDARAHLARTERFPGAKVEIAGSGSATLGTINAHDAVVLMTHSYELDRDYLTALLPLRPRYLGLLGSRRRSSLLIAEAASRLEWSVTECCEHINAPIGLDIGGEGPEAIALAIIAEAQACCMGKGSDSRRLSADLVEQCLADDSSRIYLQSQCGLDSL